MTKSKDKQKKL